MFKNTKGAIRSHKSKDRQYNEEVNKDKRTDNTMNKWKSTKGQKIIYKTPHRKLKIEQREPYLKPRMNSGAPEEQAVPAPY